MISAIVLAAGLSSRMGNPKLLLKLGSKTIIEHVVDEVLCSQVEEVLVVLGAYQQEIQKLLIGRYVKTIINPEYALGQGTSVAIGAQNVSQDARGMLFLTGDQPCIKSQIIDEIINTFNKSNAFIVQPYYGNRPGNPCLFSAKLRGELAKLCGAEGGKNLIKKYAEHLVTVPFPGGPEGWDIDTVEDYNHIIKLWPFAKPENQR